MFLDAHVASAGHAWAQIHDAHDVGIGRGDDEFHSAIAVLLRETIIPGEGVLIVAAKDAQIHIGVWKGEIVS